MPRGMLVSILKDADGHDCTNQGVTSDVKQAVLVGAGIPELAESGPDFPALYVYPWCGHYMAVPEEAIGFEEVRDRHVVNGKIPRFKHWWIFGGNWVWSSDSRFPAVAPIPVHDRREGE
jgi:hypothetical protein